MVKASDLFTDGIYPWSQMTEADKWANIKAERNRLLQECDWTQVKDIVMTEAEITAWQDYRQALRDIPQDFSSPDLVYFPARPQ